MTPMDAATLAVLDKIGGILDGQTAQDVARVVAAAAVGAWITQIAPMAEITVDVHGTFPCINCSSTLGHYPTCAARG